MSREIKFRVWNKRLKRMYSVYSINWQTGIICCTDIITGTSHTFGMIDCELIQYTGLKDKNGVEIYEGDICKNECMWEECRAISFNSLNTVCSMWPDGSQSCLYMNTLENIEVIGNIHQSPELLEASK